MGPGRSTAEAAAARQCWLSPAWGMEAASFSSRRLPPRGRESSSGVGAGDTGWSPGVSEGRWCSVPLRLLGWGSCELLSSLGPNTSFGPVL